MRFCILALKRALRTVYVPVLLLLLAVIAFFAPLIGESEGLPAAGVYSADGSQSAERIVEYLTENGFVLSNSETSLMDKIERGEYNCGVIIKNGIEDRLRNGDVEEIVKYISSPSTFATKIYENHISAAIFREYAPYITADIISGEFISEGEVIDTYFQMMEDGEKFTFEVEYSDMVPETELDVDSERGLTYTVGISSVIIFAIMSSCVCSEVGGSLVLIKGRIGASNAMKYAFVPSIAVYGLSVVFAFSIGILGAALYTGNAELLKLVYAVIIYTGLVAAFAVVISALCRETKTLQTVSFFILVAGLVTTPIYTDVSLALPVVGILRNFIPTYWLWICKDSPLLMCTVAVILLPASFSILYLKTKRNK